MTQVHIRNGHMLRDAITAAAPRIKTAMADALRTAAKKSRSKPVPAPKVDDLLAAVSGAINDDPPAAPAQPTRSDPVDNQQNRSRVSFVIPTAKIGLITEALAGEFMDLRIEPYEAPAPAGRAPSHRFNRSAPGERKPASDTIAGKAVLQFLAEHPGAQSLKVIGIGIEAKHLKAASASPVIGKLIAEGLVRRVTNGHYALVKPNGAGA